LVVNSRFVRLSDIHGTILPYAMERDVCWLRRIGWYQGDGWAEAESRWDQSISVKCDKHSNNLNY